MWLDKGQNTNNMGKENVMPIGIGSGNSPGHASHPSLTTSATHLPIHAKRSSTWVLFSKSPIGQDFSKCLVTRDNLPFWALPSPAAFEPPNGDPIGPSSSMKPTRRFVPPLPRAASGLKGLDDQVDTHKSIARYLQHWSRQPKTSVLSGITSSFKKIPGHLLTG